MFRVENRSKLQLEKKNLSSLAAAMLLQKVLLSRRTPTTYRVTKGLLIHYSELLLRKVNGEHPGKKLQ